MRLWFLFTTGKCNLRCTYCGGSFPERYVPPRPKYRLELLKDLIKPDDNVAFYGGEPLLNPEVIEWVLDNIKARRFIIQTNGTLVDNLKPEYWRRLDVVLLSIDGVEEVTDRHRGRGVYRKVLDAAERIRRYGFRGELIARMTITEDSDIYRDVVHLLKLGVFDKIHWQLNVIWCEEWEFERWLYQSYIPGLTRLFKLFIENLASGNVLRLVPFTGLITIMLTGGVSCPPCGAGTTSFTICTDGRILACPIAVREEWSTVGYVGSGIMTRVTVREPCTGCRYFRYCGGRCLYANYERYWRDYLVRLVCRATMFTIELVLSKIELVRDLVASRKISFRDVRQVGVEDSTEIIP